MKKDLKKIEEEVVSEMTSKLQGENGIQQLVEQYIKISAQVTRKFIEKYEEEN